MGSSRWVPILSVILVSLFSAAGLIHDWTTHRVAESGVVRLYEAGKTMTPSPAHRLCANWLQRNYTSATYGRRANPSASPNFTLLFLSCPLVNSPTTTPTHSKLVCQVPAVCKNEIGATTLTPAGLALRCRDGTRRQSSACVTESAGWRGGI